MTAECLWKQNICGNRTFTENRLRSGGGKRKAYGKEKRRCAEKEGKRRNPIMTQ